MSDQRKEQKPENDLSSWIFPVLMLCFVPPLGVLLIVLKVLDGSRRHTARGRHPYYVQRDAQGGMGARTTTGAWQSAPTQKADVRQTVRAKKQDKREPEFALAAQGKRLTAVGTVLTILFGITALAALPSCISALLQWGVTGLLQEMTNLVIMLCLTAGGVGCLWAGTRKRKQAQRYRNYLAMIGHRQSISISSLASASGQSPARVREDLEDMLAEGLFPAGFLDYGGDMLVLSNEGLQEEAAPKPQEPAQAAPADRENAILTEIREVNDAIANEKLSAQIDRIGLITAKILDYQKSHPERSPQLHSFLSYYLPTTLKILRAYAQLEAQEVSGQNITAAMERIEGMMDKVVEGFEKQLDQLFQGDAMDITTDVEVLERMLAKDGLSSNQEFTLEL